MNCFNAIIKTILKPEPKKNTIIKGVGEPTKKIVANAPIIIASIFEHVPIAALAVPAMCPIGDKARALTLLKRKPNEANAGTEKIKNSVSVSSSNIKE